MTPPKPYYVALAQMLRRMNLLAIKTSALRNYSEKLGISSYGEREEVIERLHRHIWLHKHDTIGD